MSFESPAWLLLLLLLVPWAALRWTRRRQRAVCLSSPGLVDLEPTWRERSRWLLPAAEALAMMLLVVALAGPRQGRTPRVEDTEGIAIHLVVDRSGSMERDDFQRGGAWITRLAAVKDVARRFVAGQGGFTGRTSDLVGLLTFAREAEPDCPLTLDHPFLLDRLARVEIVETYREDGTAIGDALGLAVARLHDHEAFRHEPAEDADFAKVVILLTDGENNAGRLTPLEAAELAAAVDVRIYTIGVGESDVEGRDAEQHVLRTVAERTGGRFYTAADMDDLESIYTEIDRLERVRLKGRRYTDYRHLAIEPFRLGPFAFPAFALAAVVLLVAGALLGATVYRTSP